MSRYLHPRRRQRLALSRIVQLRAAKSRASQFQASQLLVPRLLAEFRQDAETNWWTVTLPSQPSVVSQGRTLEEGLINVRNALALVRDDAQTVDLIGRTRWDHRKDLSPKALSAIKVAGNLRLILLGAEFRSQTMTRVAVMTLRDEKYSFRRAGRLLGITHARVEQIFKEKRREEDELGS